MKIKGLETSKNLLRLTGEYVSSDEGNSDEDCKEGGAASMHGGFEESKEAALTELPEDYDLVEEVRDEECE